MTRTIPGGFLFDYGGTLVEEISFDVRAGNEWLLSRASYRPPNLGIDDVVVRARRITSEVADRRDETHLETPWPAKAAGMTTAWFDRFNTTDPARTADYVFADWKELVLHTSRLAELAFYRDVR